MVTDRPLASLPAEQAEQLIRALFAPNQRFARAYQHHYRFVLRQNEPTAKLNTRIELARAAATLLARLDDPCMHVLCRDDEPVGLFGFRGDGVAHSIAVLDAYAHLYLELHVFVAIARMATSAGHRELRVITNDRRLASRYAQHGMELAVTDAKHLVGRLDLARCENRIRVAHLEHTLASELRDAA